MNKFSTAQPRLGNFETSDAVKQVLSMDADYTGGSTSSPPPLPLSPSNSHHVENGGLLSYGFIMMIILIMIGRMVMKRCFIKTSAVTVDLLEGESTMVRKAIEDLYTLHPKACRNCHASAQEPDFLITGQGEEECQSCYARGRDPYDTTLKMKKQGEYKISPTYGVDPLYRGYALPGQKIQAIREEEADQWEA